MGLASAASATASLKRSPDYTGHLLSANVQTLHTYSMVRARETARNGTVRHSKPGHDTSAAGVSGVAAQ